MADLVETPVAEAATPSIPPPDAAPQPVVKGTEPDPSDYLAKIQANAAKFEAGLSTSERATSTPEEGSASPASEDALALDPAAAVKAYQDSQKAPEEKAAEEKKPTEAAKPEEAPKPEEAAPAAAEKPVEVKDGESIRQVIKRSNLPPELKETITNLAFKADAFEKIGFSVEQARQLKDLGITPEVVAERVALHPSVEDERRDAQLAISMRKLGADLVEDPARFVDGIAGANPEMAQRLIEAAYERAQTYLPDRVVADSERTIWQVLNAAYADPDNADETRLEAIRNVAALFFPDGPPDQANASTEVETDLFRSADPIHREYARLQQERAQFEAQQRSSFASTMFNTGRNAVFEETKKAWEEVRPKSMPEKVSNAIVNDIFEKVGQTLLSSEAIKRDMEGFLAGPLDQNQFNKAVGWLLDRAKPTILIKRKAALDEWGDVFNSQLTPAPATAPSPKPAAAQSSKPDVGRGSSSPGPSAPVDIKAQVMSEMKQKGWSYFEATQEYLRRKSAMSR